MRIPVVLDHGKPGLARRADVADPFVDFLVASRPGIDRVVESRDHQIAERHTVRFELIHLAAQPGRFPGNRRPSGKHMIHAELLDASRCLWSGPAIADRKTNLGRVGTFEARPRHARGSAEWRSKPPCPATHTQFSS